MQLLSESLTASGPHPSLGTHADTYGRLIGSWAGEYQAYPIGGSAVSTSAEVHFAWALDGRAVQDVWITPSRKDRAAGVRAAVQMYGTTLRIFDAKSESWRVLWLDPASGNRCELEGRRQGDDIVQIGTREGWPIRWTLSSIRSTSFVWQGHVLNTDGVSWRLQAEFKLHRQS
jgi:hypothetical protein